MNESTLATIERRAATYGQREQEDILELITEVRRLQQLQGARDSAEAFYVKGTPSQLDWTIKNK
jgi:hypothetical protein